MVLTPKFSIGDKVKVKGAPDVDVGKVFEFGYRKGGFYYKITSKEASVAEKKIIKGSTVVDEKNLVKVKDKK